MLPLQRRKKDGNDDSGQKQARRKCDRDRQRKGGLHDAGDHVEQRGHAVHDCERQKEPANPTCCAIRDGDQPPMRHPRCERTDDKHADRENGDD